MPAYGIGFEWDIVNSAQQIEVLRYSSSGLSTGTQESLVTLAPGTLQYIDYLPNDNTMRWYNVRHTLPGYMAGAYSTAVQAKPRPIPDAGPIVIADPLPTEI